MKIKARRLRHYSKTPRFHSEERIFFSVYCSAFSEANNLFFRVLIAREFAVEETPRLRHCRSHRR